MLAQSLDIGFVDSDKAIEEESGLRITDIFELYGEDKFRELERRVIARLVTEETGIISVGGGAF